MGRRVGYLSLVDLTDINLMPFNWTVKVLGSIPDGVTGIFQWLNPYGRIVSLGSTQPLTEMSTRDLPWGVKTAGA
jgi:hypothetical protein